MYIRLNITAALLAGLLSCTIPAAFALEPAQTQLTADVMDYDIESGEFSASGNVVIVRGTLTLKADRGGANSNTQKAHVDGNVHAFGEHEGEPLDAKCDLLESDFSAPEGDYKMTGNVDAMFGTRILRSRTAWLKGRDFGAENVTHFEDKSQNMVLACDVLDGNYDDNGVVSATGVGAVHVFQNDEEKDSDLWCDELNYDRVSDAITATGNSKMHVRQKNDTKNDMLLFGENIVYAIQKGTVTATAKEQVHVLQKDTDRNSEMWCDEMVYSHIENTLTGTGNAKIHVLQETGNVRETTITGDNMLYSIAENIVTATGNTKGFQDGRSITAQTLLYHTDTGRIEARGTPRITVDLSKNGDNKGNQNASPPTDKQGAKRKGTKKRTK